MRKPFTQLARKLRKNSTDAERLLWHHLRGKRFNHLKFRRQQPIGPYIVDLICFEKRLIIEVDGSQHNENQKKDLIRTQWLNNEGYQVIRFWNHEVLQNSTDVLEEIWRYCE
ncbi:endonuclease domain-containing protein [bacterium]|nr:endonuclease domain-containing protein [bacterium]RQV92120.1 MAG: endonuclease domain-containing protein [bacterium]